MSSVRIKPDPEYRITGTNGKLAITNSEHLDDNRDEPISTDSRHTRESSSIFVRQDSVFHDRTPLWKQCENDDIEHRVKCKETAVKNGVKVMKKLHYELLGYRSNSTDVDNFLASLEKMIKRGENHQIFIGFMGSTGAGKTSLINALLNFNHLLPSSSERSCTAVATQISWNTSDDPTRAFRASITYITREEWNLQLKTLYKDLNESKQSCDSEDEEDDEQSAAAEVDRENRIRDAFDKLGAVYPHLTEDQIGDMSADELLGDKKVQKLLGSTKIIENSDADEFSASIKSYVDSSQMKDENEKSMAHWPLIKVVEIECKSAILRNGIVLVDLPGAFDTVAARSQVAENYRQKLAVTCVVTPIKRGATDQQARMILTGQTGRQLGLDGNFNAARVCVIMTCTDAMPVVEHMREHPQTRILLSQEIEEEKKLNSEIDKQEENLATLDKSIRKLEGEIKNHDVIIKTLRRKGQMPSRKRQHDGSSPVHLSAEEAKIKLSKQDQEREKTIKSQNRMITKYNVVLSEISIIRDRIQDNQGIMIGACIKRRNESAASNIRADFRLRRKKIREHRKTMASDEKDDDLKVFCISATAYQGLLERCPVPGFIKKADTGIPDLKTWLISSTLVAREDEATVILEGLESMQETMTIWAQDSSLTNKIPLLLRVQIESRAEVEFQMLRKNLITLKKQKITFIQNFILGGIDRVLSDAVGDAIHQCTRTVKLFEVKSLPDGSKRRVLWSTYRAINSRLGIFESNSTQGRIFYDWTEDLTANLTGVMLPKWITTFHEVLPGLIKSTSLEVHRCINGFAESLFNSTIAIEKKILGPLRRLEPNYRRLAGEFQDLVKSIIENLRNASKHINRMVHPIIAQEMEPGYLRCANETGAGHFKRSKALMNEHINDIRRSMFESAKKEVMGALESEINKLDGQFDEAIEIVLSHGKQDLSIMLDQNCASGERKSHRNLSSATMKVIYQNVRVAFVDLDIAWRSNEDGEEKDFYDNEYGDTKEADVASELDEEDDEYFDEYPDQDE